MSLKLRVLTQDGNSVSAGSTTEELLHALLDGQSGLILLDNDDEESLRGWLLVRAMALEPGEMVSIDKENSVCIGKTADGQAFVRSASGEWPPIKPELGGFI